MYAEVSELADELDSGSSGGFRREGSSPADCTTVWVSLLLLW